MGRIFRRSMGNGGSQSRRLEASARIEVPFLSGGRARSDADERLRGASPDIAAAEAVESRLRLRAAYLDAWFEQERLEVIQAQLQALEQLVASVRKRVEGGAEAPYEVALAEGEMLRSRLESDGVRAALGDAWSALSCGRNAPPVVGRRIRRGQPGAGVRG